MQNLLPGLSWSLMAVNCGSFKEGFLELENFSLKGKVAVVTGAAGLLGVRHCRALAQAGAIVYATDLNAEALKKAVDFLVTEVPGAQVQYLVMDVTSLDSIKAVEQSILKSVGKIDILINNAAIDPKVKQGDQLLEASRLENFDLQSWNFQLAVGLTGSLLCAQVFGAWMASHGGGVILNVASDLGVIAPDQRLYRVPGRPEHLQPVKPVTYSVIKHGLLGLTKYLASYWAKDGVRVNAISPGGVYNKQPDEFVGRLSNLIPMGRMAKVDEYEGTIQYLCSNASSYMTGQNIVLDGGRSII
jgi:NAD(P)-dependent dehydrogenase (short-subunit alcohol dehydrogenase family)